MIFETVTTTGGCRSYVIGCEPTCAAGGLWGVYGTQGAASASNAPGARSDASSWIDVSGNLW
jgi:hypothetical protein